MTSPNTPVATATAPEFAILALDLIVASPTNPRTHFNADKMQELTESIKASGVIEPIQVRPLPGSRAGETFANRKRGAPLPTHEIITGERRWRACHAAALTHAPCLIKNLSDAQVLEIQLVENLQRDDLTPLEEADGYQRLMVATGATLDAVASKIGKSKSYVYARLKLLDLGVDAREALRKGDIDASKALLLARIPDTKLQAKALKEISRKDYDGTPMSLRSAQMYVSREFMLKLSSAPWKLTDATLLPAAGSCKDCPKRTGANPDLFADVDGADMCIDPKCFDRKQTAHEERALDLAHQRGQTILQGKEAKAIMPSAYRSQLEGGWVKLDDKPLHGGKSYRQLLKKDLDQDGQRPTLLADPHHKGELIEIMPAATLASMLKAKGLSEPAKQADESAAAQERDKAEADKAKRKSQFENGWRKEAVRQVWAEINTAPPLVTRTIGAEAFGWGLSIGMVRHLAKGLARRLSADQARLVAQLMGVGSVGPIDSICAAIDSDNTTDQARLPAIIRLLAMAPEAHWTGYAYYGSDDDSEDRIPAIAINLADTGLSLGTIKATVKAELAAADKAKKAGAKAKPAKADAAKPGKGGAGKKATRVPTKPAKADVRYRNPDTGETWSGFGQKPRWLVVAIQRGRKLEDFDTSAKVLSTAADPAAAFDKDMAAVERKSMLNPDAGWPFPTAAPANKVPA